MDPRLLLDGWMAIQLLYSLRAEIERMSQVKIQLRWSRYVRKLEEIQPRGFRCGVRGGGLGESPAPPEAVFFLFFFRRGKSWPPDKPGQLAPSPNTVNDA